MSAKQQRLRLAAFLGAVVVAVAVGVVLATGVLSSGDGKRSGEARPGEVRALAGPDAAPFTLNVPDGWERVDQKVVEKRGPEHAVAVRKSDGSGLVTVRVDGPVEQSLKSLKGDLQVALKERMPKAKIVDSHTVKVGAGRALFTSWVQDGEPNVQTNLVVPAGEQSYTLDAVFAAKSKKTAQEVGLILRAFDLRQ